MSWNELYQMIKDPELLLKEGGFWALLLIVFLENGVIIGIFLPGDYLLFSAGMFVHYLDINIYVLTASVCLAAVAGTFTGYITGKWSGRKFLQKDTWLVKKKHIVLTRAYFVKYGGRTIMISKFLPYVRTLAPILAGVVEMRVVKMMKFNVIGAALWSGVLILGGYYLHETIPGLEENIGYIIFAFIAISTSVVVVSYLRSRKKTTD